MDTLPPLAQELIFLIRHTGEDEAALLSRALRIGLDALYRQAVEQALGRPARPDDLFIAGLTYAQYFALSEAEQDAVWNQVFAEASLDMEAVPEADVVPQT